LGPILGGISAAGAAAAAIVTAIKNAKAQNVAQTKLEGHNCIIEEQNSAAHKI